MGNKQEEFEIYLWPQAHNVIAVTGTWLDNLCDWNTVMERYILFRKETRKAKWWGWSLLVRAAGMYQALPKGDEEYVEILMAKN